MRLLRFTPVVTASTSVFPSILPLHSREVFQHEWKEKILRQKKEKVMDCFEYEIFVEINE